MDIRRVASFDIGLKNTSVCVLDLNGNSFQIKKWQIISIRGKNISDYTCDIIDKLRKMTFGIVDNVLIEQQINRNTQMKVLSHIVQAYFICEVKVPPSNVEFVSPKLRIHSSDINYRQIVNEVKQRLDLENVYSRKEFKTISVMLARHFLSEHRDWLEFLEKTDKKDDLADSFVQAMAWSSNHSCMDVD